jgi:tRNA (adenine57-N1/adenine58-N1)-methyltransferase
MSAISASQPAESPWFRPQAEHFGAGDLVLLITSDQSRYLITLRPGNELHTHQGIFPHNTVIGEPSGAAIAGTQGHPALALTPTLDDLMRHLKRGSQVIYPKDAAWLVHRLSLHSGSRVIEAGTGSGGLTTAMAWAVAPAGMIYTYEVREDAYRVARRNLERVGLLPYVTMHERAIGDGFAQQNVDALFLDVRDPWEHLPQVRAALRPGGSFAALAPTTNQVSTLLEAMEQSGFADIAVEEILLRPWKPVPDRLRPADTMAAHTGFLIFGRPLADATQAGNWLGRTRQRYIARLAAETKYAEEAARREGDENPEGKKKPPLPLP